MKLSLNWLKEHLETSATAQQIAEALTALGLEVESVTDRAAALAPFTVAEILAAERHPNAEKLQVCRVASDAGELQIVCGAANARAGIKVALAKEGALIPKGNFKIKKTAIRGVESNGMLCSAEELELADSSEGIIELPAGAKVGEPLARVLGMEDVLFDIAITPNRADALGVHGVARDLAAAGIGTLKPQPHIPHKGTGKSPLGVSIETADCPLFIGCHIRDVKNADSPEWLKQKLASIGQKPISALVDITNYFTFAYGRPLHVFDADALSGGIVVRHAREGETLNALNGKSYTLAPGMVVIADHTKPLALGGIIGGLESGCTHATRNVFLEVALFHPVSIARTGRALQIDSDSRYRFERGVDAAFAPVAADMAVAMIRELCGGEASEYTQAGALPAAPAAIAFRPQRVAELGGLSIPPARIKEILEKLGCAVGDSGPAWSVTPPASRLDLTLEADLVEEVLRVAGYNHIPAASLPAPPGIPAAILTPEQKKLQTARHLLAARGLYETHHWSFVSQADAARFGGQAEALELANPISAELSVMRPSLLPGLIAAYGRNSRRSFHDAAFFEVGPSFHAAQPGGQKTIIAGLRGGNALEHAYPSSRFARTPRPADLFDAKADVFALLASYGLNPEKLEIATDTPAWYHPGRSGRVMLGKNAIAVFGELHPGIASAYDLADTPLAAFELDVSALPASKPKGKARGKLAASDFQAVTRDFAFVVDAVLPAAELIKSVRKAGDALLREVALFDVYSGKGVADGKKSIALQVVLQADDRTLSDEEINAVCRKIVDGAAKHCAAELRA